MDDEWVARARQMLEANQYLTLATADASGRPWATTVWYAAWQRTRPADALDLELVWLSHPAARHSQNLLARREIGISVFDSSQPAGTGDGLQLSAVAAEVDPAGLDEAAAVFSEASLAAGGNAWARADVEGGAVPRLYVAQVERAFVLGGRERHEVPLA